MQKLLIAEETEEFSAALTAKLQDNYQIQSCQNGLDALALLRSFQPDVLVLDMMLPGLDGIAILNAAVSEGIFPMVLLVSRFYSDYVTQSATSLGIGYLMRKPCNLQATVAHIRNLTQRIHSPVMDAPNPKAQISSLLLTLGIPTKLRGYQYMLEAILLMAGNPGLSITKELYPSVSQVFNNDPSHIERSIRSAIEKGWLRRDDHIWSVYFPAGPDGMIPKPTNAEFISRLANSLQFYHNTL